MKKFRQFAFVLMLALSLTTFAACGKDKDGASSANHNGTVNDATENTGRGDGAEELDRAGENAKDAVDDAGDAIRDTGEAIKDGVTGDDAADRDDTAVDEDRTDAKDAADAGENNVNTTDNSNR